MKTTSTCVRLQFSLCRRTLSSFNITLLFQCICCEWMQQWIAVTSSLWSLPFADLSLSIHSIKIIMFLISLFKCVSCAMAGCDLQLKRKKGDIWFSFFQPIVQISELLSTVMCYRKTCRKIIWLQLHLIELCVSSSTCATILQNHSVFSFFQNLNKHISEMP